MAPKMRSLLKDARQHEEYWQEWLVSDFTEELCRRLEALGLSRTAFAHRIGSTPAYVTKVLRGEENLTAKTMAKLASAADSVVRIHLAPVGVYGAWIDFGGGEDRKTTSATLTGVAYPTSQANVRVHVLPAIQSATSDASSVTG